jgi:hypothetical protein
LDKPTIKGRVERMNRTYVIIAAVVAIALIASAAFIIYYQGQISDSGIEALQNLVDDTATRLS